MIMPIALLAVVATLVPRATPSAAPSFTPSFTPLVDSALTQARTSDALVVEVIDTLDLSARIAGAGACTLAAAVALAPLSTSGKVSVRLEGLDGEGLACGATGVVRVRVTAPALQLTAASARGESVAAVALHAEVHGDVRGEGALLATLPDGARAVRPLARGAILRPSDVEHGPRLGEDIHVVVRSGGLEISEAGRVAACAGGAARAEGSTCATLRGGRRVTGHLDDRGALVVQVRR